jgi:hypothetical protein
LVGITFVDALVFICSIRGVVIMDEAKAREILGTAIKSSGELYCCGTYICYNKELELTLDGDFDLDYLKAIIWWIENNEKTT